MQCIGRLRSCFREPGGKYVTVFETDDPVTAQADAVRGKCLSISARVYRPPRSLSANAYAWSLISRLAAKMSTSGQAWTKEEMYREMLARYGADDTDGHGRPLTFTVRADVEPGKFGVLCRPIGAEYRNGEHYVHYQAVKGSSQYDSEEMAHFLDGIISDCREQGIETLPQAELDRIRRSWR